MRVAWWEGRAFVVAALLLSALPLLWPAVPPLTDLPGHIGRYHIAAGLAGSADLQRHWTYQWALIPNLGVDLLVLPLTPWLGAEVAAKLVVLLIPPLFVGGLMAVSRAATGRLTPAAAFAFPLAYADPFQMGFVNFAAAVALALLALAGWIALGERGRWATRMLLAVPVSCLLWLCHSFGWGLLGLLAFAWELRRPDDRPWPLRAIRAALACLPMALPLLAMVGGDGELGAEWSASGKVYWLTSVLRDRWIGWDLASTGVLPLVLAIALRHRAVEPRLGWLAAAALLAFLGLPRLLMGGAYVDMRVLPTALALALLAVRPGERLALRVALAAIGFFVARTLATTASFLLYAQAQAEALAVVPSIPRGAAVLVLVDEPCSTDWRNDRLGHIAGPAVARRDIWENGQWLIPGQQLLGSHLPATLADPSQLIRPFGCGGMPGQAARAIAAARAAGVDHVWTIGFTARPRLAPGIVLVAHDRRSALYRLSR